MKKTPRVKCPTCKKEGDWFAGKSGPFCSPQCKWVDLGKWFGEENRISERLRPDHFRDYENIPSSAELDQPEDN